MVTLHWQSVPSDQVSRFMTKNSKPARLQEIRAWALPSFKLNEPMNQPGWIISLQKYLEISTDVSRFLYVHIKMRCFGRRLKYVFAVDDCWCKSQWKQTEQQTWIMTSRSMSTKFDNEYEMCFLDVFGCFWSHWSPHSSITVHYKFKLSRVWNC